MKTLIRQITDKSQGLQKKLTELSVQFNKAETTIDKERIILEVLATFDEVAVVVSFVMQNTENIEQIINSRNAALDIYKKLTGKDYGSDYMEIDLA
jgi:ATP:corrinoid adenosyltransferase